MKKYVFTQEQIETLIREAMLIDSLRKLALECNLIGIVSIEEFKRSFSELKSETKAA